MEGYARWLACIALGGDPADLPQALDGLLELASLPGGLPVVLAVFVETSRAAITTAAAGDPGRAHLARWEIELIQGGVAPG